MLLTGTKACQIMLHILLLLPQDRIRDERQTVAAADVALMLEAAGVDRVVAVDLHRGQLEGFFTCSTQVRIFGQKLALTLVTNKYIFWCCDAS